LLDQEIKEEQPLVCVFLSSYGVITLYLSSNMLPSPPSPSRCCRVTRTISSPCWHVRGCIPSLVNPGGHGHHSPHCSTASQDTQRCGGALDTAQPCVDIEYITRFMHVCSCACAWRGGCAKKRQRTDGAVDQVVCVWGGGPQPPHHLADSCTLNSCRGTNYVTLWGGIAHIQHWCQLRACTMLLSLLVLQQEANPLAAPICVGAHG
jgi:hypothetical protein